MTTTKLSPAEIDTLRVSGGSIFDLTRAVEAILDARLPGGPAEWIEGDQFVYRNGRWVTVFTHVGDGWNRLRVGSHEAAQLLSLQNGDLSLVEQGSPSYTVVRRGGVNL